MSITTLQYPQSFEINHLWYLLSKYYQRHWHSNVEDFGINLDRKNIKSGCFGLNFVFISITQIPHMKIQSNISEIPWDRKNIKIPYCKFSICFSPETSAQLWYCGITGMRECGIAGLRDCGILRLRDCKP